MANVTQKKYKAQTWLSIRLDSELSDDDMTLVNIWKIWFKKPSGTIDSVAAIQDGVTSFVLYAHPPATASIIDETGVWSFWVRATLLDGRSAPGEPHVEKMWLEST